MSIGVNGILSVRASHDNLMAMKSCLTDISQPVYVENPYLALPWMVPTDQPFVTHFNYYTDRVAGIEKEGGGIGGLMDRGYFATIVLSSNATGRFDGSDLSRYRPRPTACPDVVIYDRIDGPALAPDRNQKGSPPKS